MRQNQSPSVYSIFNNALPYYLDRVDLAVLSAEGLSFAASFLRSLLSGEVNEQFDASELSSEKVSHLYFEAKNLSKTLGARTLGFGYPLVIDTYEGELMVAPLFVWQISLEPAQTKEDAWVIKYDKSNTVLPNYQLIRYIKEKFDYDLKAELEGAIENEGLTAGKLEKTCLRLADRFQFTSIVGEGNILEAPGINEIGDFTNGAVHWSGVLAIYPPQYQKIKPLTNKPEDIFVPGEDVAEPDPFVFPYLAADPEQVSALENLLVKKVSVVEGIDTLGKGQTLTNLLLAALMQGKKCLVVSERAPALKKNQHLLAKTGLHQLNFLLTDILHDRDQMLELLKLAAKGVDRAIELNKPDFQFKKNKYIREKNRLDQAYQASVRKVFGDHTWTDTVGLFLRSNAIEGKELLGSHLQRTDFRFDKTEHEELKQGVEKCYPLFQKIKTLNHPLSNLNDRVFQQVTPEDGKAYVVDQLGIFLEKARKLHHRYISEIESYKNRLRQHYQGYIAEIDGLYRKLDEKILDYKDQLGEDFLEAGPGTFNFPLFFSKKKKRIVAAQNDVAKSYQALSRAFSEKPYFEFEFGAAKEGMLIAEVMHNMSAFDGAYAFWRNKLDQIIQEDTVRLNSKTAHPSLGVKEEVTQLEYALDLLLEELNEACLYQTVFANKTLTVPQRQKYLESIIEQMEHTQLNLRDFPLFYQWQSNWLELPPVGQKVVASLVKVKPDDWLAAFESWYFFSLLTEKWSAHLPGSLDVIENYDQSWHALKPLIFNYIYNVWQEKQIDGLKKLKKKNKTKYRAIFEKPLFKNPPAGHLADIFEDSMDAVTDFLPILFVTPHVALNIVPDDFKFDLVIFEEANRFSVEGSTEIANLGHQMMIFGSDDSNGNETSLLQYALENEVPSRQITNRYEAPLQNLPISDLARTSFFHTQKCSVENLEGRFHEMEGVNDLEAQQIIRLLNQIKQTPQRVFPSVGIVAFTIEQRNLISSYILKLKQQNVLGSEKIRQLERNGMGVYFVEELFGQHFDILIVSFTFGVINLKGKLTKKISMLNTQEGISYLQLLVNKTLQELYLLHSFSDEHLAAFKGKTWDKGTWLMAHFIEMSEAVQHDNREKYLQATETIGKREPRLKKAPSFTENLVHSLAAYIDTNRFSLHLPWEDVLLPIVIAPLDEEGSKVVIVPDGFFAGTNFTSGVWEKAHINKLKNEKFTLIPVWSTDWMKDPVSATRKLASKIIKMDGGVANVPDPDSLTNSELSRTDDPVEDDNSKLP